MKTVYRYVPELRERQVIERPALGRVIPFSSPCIGRLARAIQQRSRTGATQPKESK